MGNSRARMRRTGVVAAVAALLIGTGAAGGAASAVPGPDLELEWEVGRAGTVWDGDTLQVEIDRTSSPYSGSQRVRMVGVQAPETTTPECGGAEAKALLKSLAPSGTPIQLRAQKGTSFDTTDGRARLVRSVYAQDDEGNWYDISRQLVGSGRALWFPFGDTGEQPEWAHNLEYRVLAEDARRDGRGLWAGDTCGGWRGNLNIRIWAKYYGTERVYIENNGGSPIDLSGWIVRDAAVKGYRTLAPGTVIQPGQVREVYAGDMNLNNLPADNPAFEGDAVYLMEPANSRHTTGNLRAWFPYPCNPDDCVDPLVGALKMSTPVLDSPPVRKPSDPGSVTSTASVDGLGNVTVAWAAPNDLGGPKVTYRIKAVPDTGTVAPELTSTTTSVTFGGLPLGVGYRFDVRAEQSAGDSGWVRSAASVAAAGLPGAPTTVVAEPRNAAAVVRWTAPAVTGGFSSLDYTATATPVPTVPPSSALPSTCTVTDGSTSCRMAGLANDQPYTVTVVASNGIGTGPASAPSAAVTPSAASTGPDPVPAPIAETAVTTRTSGPTTAPPAADPWIGGQYVDVVNTSGSVARLGGYGLWDAQSSRYNNGGKLENRAAYLFDPNLALAPGATLRVHFVDGTAPAADTAALQRVFAGDELTLASDSDFVELSNLNGAQVACRSRSGLSCEKAKQQSAPTQPVGVTARTTPSSVSVAWGAPISRGGLAISGYTATAFNAPTGGAPIGSCSTDGSGRSCSFPASIGTRYWVEVVAANASGPSGPSWRVLAAPRTVPGMPGNVAVAGNPGGLAVSWAPATENGAAITRYTAAAYRAGTGGSPVGSCTTNSGAVTSCTITGLAAGTTYYVDVTATNRAGNGTASSPRVTGAPGPGSAVTTYTKGRVVVRWDPAPAGSGITGYQAKVYTKASGGSLLATCSAGATATSCTTKKLKKRSKYYVDLITQSAAGSFVMRPRIVTGPPRKASAPRVASATPVGRQVAIAWTPPGFNGYSYLRSYEAKLYSKAKGGATRARCTANAATLTCTTKAVKKGSYWSAVRVKNSKGWSSWSKRVKVVIR